MINLKGKKETIVFMKSEMGEILSAFPSQIVD